MILILLFSFFSQPSLAANKCDAYVKLAGFTSQKMGERPRLSAYNEYLNLFAVKDRHLPKKFEEFKNGPVLALKFQSPEKKKMTLILVESGHLLGVFADDKQWYCEKEE